MIALLFCLSTAMANRAEVGGYFRVMARPDLQGGSGRLGYWNLYGRLLNEGPYATVDFKYSMLEQNPDGNPWTRIHARIEGGSIGNADASNGSLSQLRLSQTYAVAGNLLLKDVIWQMGTLESYFGDLGLYDMRPSMIFFDTVGLSARYQKRNVEWLIGAGDCGYQIRGNNYNSIPTIGSSFRIRMLKRIEIGLAGQYRHEPGVEGNQVAPYSTPNLDYEEMVRGEVIQNYMLDNPDRTLDFPDPDLRSASSGKIAAYFGFGNFGPVIWNNFYASWEKFHPQGPRTENYQGQDYNIYVTDLTDERTQLFIGNELQLRIIPKRWDIAWGALYANHQDNDNDITPSDDDRTYYSTVLRSQHYITPTVHFLVESSFAEEKSRNGNLYREHADSIFRNDDSNPDARGLENGDTDQRITWQGKGGFVFNPMGRGIFNRPSLRILYGAQHSNQNNAFGNRFVENLDQYNEFGNVERHWHQLIALEMEAWF